MKKIHKQQFKINDYVVFTVPINSKILDIQVQGGIPTIWYMFEEDDAFLEEKICIRIIGTGQPFELEGFTFFKTFQMGRFVWHVFKEQK